ncbi:MAG TPA: CHAD domain-containing protein [Pseudonocardiaceae bacterium]|nr:CHAD domain-containing protein [Pseudonocardiaceae bacterium]
MMCAPRSQPDNMLGVTPDEPSSDCWSKSSHTCSSVAGIARLSKAVQRAGDDPRDEVLHALRTQGKRLRCTGELAAIARCKPVRKLVESTVAWQDVLGKHQDACVAQHRARQLLDDSATSSASAWSSPPGSWWSAKRPTG